MDSHQVVDAAGRQPRRVVCLAHAGCTWSREVGLQAHAADPIVLALVRMHAREGAAPPVQMMGHPRKAR